MDTIIESVINKENSKAASSVKWWQTFRQKIKTFLFAEATEQQRRNALDYYQYWYKDILEEDLQKQKISNN